MSCDGKAGAAVELSLNDERMLIADLREAFKTREVPPGKGRDVHAGSSCSSSAMGQVMRFGALMPGSRLGEFEIQGAIGYGGMGIVYRARQVTLNREVALKVLPAIARHRRSAVQRFRTEALAVARLNHPNIVSVFANGEHDGYLFYAMELVDGISLDAVIHRRPEFLNARSALGACNGAFVELQRSVVHAGVVGAPAGTADEAGASARNVQRSLEDFRHIARMMAAVADALDHAHQYGVIHRDIKPQNLLLSTDGAIRITDFGLAQLMNEPHMTVSGEIMGTPTYLSPEQARGEVGAIDRRTDVYSLGATLYEALTCRRPFDGETREQIVHRICSAAPRAPRQWDPRIPFDLETICLRAMDKDPQRRFLTAGALAEDLRRFADGRPILSRRAGIVERSWKLVSRHKALSLAGTAVILAAALAAGLLYNVRSNRLQEAHACLQRAYEHLAFSDYRTPELIAEDIEAARTLGADDLQLNLVGALASLGQANQVQAIDQLQYVLQAQPDDVEALYLLAWAQWRSHQRAASRATFERAEQLGGPTTAAEWFFRGLAVHFDRPALAAESYHQANALRAQEHDFYPLAILHLARAYNQLMYVNRSLETFAVARASLLQLIDNGYYGAYPYYLLSIAHRLAGDISSARNAGQDGHPADNHHFGEALLWARRGQLVDPSDDRSVTAEAECLERLGQYEEAIENRTRAIHLAQNDLRRCEGYHYRWRLRYWTGDLAGALEDIEQHQACMPQSLHYAQLYPALVLAEMGQMTQALEKVRAVAETSPDDARAILWSATFLRILGRPAEARALLLDSSATDLFDGDQLSPQEAAWMEALLEFAIDGRDLTALLAIADAEEAAQNLRAEALFHAAAKALADGERNITMDLLRQAHNAFDSEVHYTFHAKVLYEKMRCDAAWPPWNGDRAW